MAIMQPSRQLDTLDATAHHIAARAAAAGIALEYLGVQPLFAETRAYCSFAGDWIIGPAHSDPQVRHGRLAIPREKLRTLTCLLQIGLDFPAIYVAHEIPRGRLRGADAKTSPGSPPVRRWQGSIDPATSGRLLDPVPAAPHTAAVADRLGAAAGMLLGLLGMTSLVGRETAVALASAVTQRLDPIVFGACSVDGRTAPGAPAAWFLLARWTY